MLRRVFTYFLRLTFIAWWGFSGFHFIASFPCHAIVHHKWGLVSDYGTAFTIMFLGPWAIVKLLDKSGLFEEL